MTAYRPDRAAGERTPERGDAAERRYASLMLLLPDGFWPDGFWPLVDELEAIERAARAAAEEVADDYPRVMAERDRWRAEAGRLRAEVLSWLPELACRCEPAWTERGLHAHDCTGYVHDGLTAALAGTGVGAGDGMHEPPDTIVEDERA